MIFRPIDPWHISQRFGENKACVDIATGKKVISCDGNNPPSGYRSLYGPKGHNGMDISSKRWNRVYAANDGVVRETQTMEQRGLGVGIVHEWQGKFYKSRYWHLAAIDVDLGQRVQVGDFIGYADNTGFSSGDHLHFELGTCNADGSNYVPVNPLNFLQPEFALDAKSTIKKLREQIAVLADMFADFMRERL